MTRDTIKLRTGILLISVTNILLYLKQCFAPTIKLRKTTMQQFFPAQSYGPKQTENFHKRDNRGKKKGNYLQRKKT